MRDFVPVLIEDLASYNNRLDSESAINNLFANYYIDPNIRIHNDEYSFIMRHITTPSLRSYFHNLAHKHNLNVVPESEMRLRFVMQYPMILNTAEQDAYAQSVREFKAGIQKRFDLCGTNSVDPNTLKWIHNELDHNWQYVGVHKN